MSVWDFVLIVVVSVQATVLAYLHHPKWKAFLLTLPLPFTVAVLALGHRIDATNVWAMGVLLLYSHAVRVLHQVLRWPILAAIAASALLYCLVGWSIASIIPGGDAAFWLACVSMGAVAAIVLLNHPHKDEPGHRSPLPIWSKLPIIVVIVAGLILIKHQLRGFMTMFPMVGVIGAYEARHSLWTMARQIPVVVLTMLAYMIVSRLASPAVGLGPSLALGWLAFLCVLVPMTRGLWAGPYFVSDRRYALGGRPSNCRNTREK